MILLWTTLKYAREIKFGKNLSGITYMDERPDIAIISNNEALSAIPNNDAGFRVRGYLIQHLIQALKSNDPTDVIVIE